MLPLIPVVVYGTTAALGLYGATQGVRGLMAKDEAEYIYNALKAREDRLNHRRLSMVQRGEKLNAQDARLYAQAEELFVAYAKVAEAVEKDLQREYQRQRNAYANSTWKGVEGHAASNGWKKAGRFAGDTAKAAMAGAAARQGAIVAIRHLGSASTGTAIRSLTGVAAQRATLSAAGGGAAAVGGGGIAAGVAALNVLAIGGTVAVFGQRFLKGQQAKLEEAQREQRKANQELNAFEGELDAFDAGLKVEEERVQKACNLRKNLMLELGKAKHALRERNAERAQTILAFAHEDLKTFATMIRRPDPALLA